MMEYDLTIVGSGCAGLSLAYHLLHSELKQCKILLIDKNISSEVNKTWCFWSETPLKYKSAQHTYWDNITYATDGFIKTQSIKPYKYYCVDATTFYQEIHQILRLHPNVDMIEEEVLDLSSDNAIATIKTCNRTIKTRFAFDSRIQMDPSDPPQINLHQNFYGIKVQFSDPVFEEDAMTLMDFRIEKQNPASFVYILPFNKRQALIEYTEFSSDNELSKNFKHKLDHYIRQHISTANYQVTSAEQGSIPMTNYKFPKKTYKNVFKIGIAGGQTKSTTGYTFLNIQKHSLEIINELTTGIEEESDTARFEFYDDLLLNIIEKQPENVKPIMDHLFGNNDFDLILKFLAEDTNLLEELNLLGFLPWKPFIQAFVSTKLKVK